MNNSELACVWASMVEISDRHKEILFSIAEPEFLIENLEVYKEEIEQEIGEKGYNELQKISRTDVINFVEKITRQNIKIITKFSDEYPESLFDLAYPPLVLYCVGDIRLLKSECFTVVGTRRCSQEGFLLSRNLCEDLAANGLVIVSGLADGIDSSAHLGALDAGGKTIAVLGFGISFLTTSPSRSLAVDIVKKGGLIITEYKPSMIATKFTFPVRNRIMAALSKATLAVEAPHKSGTRYTVEYALKMGRKVFAVAGRIGSENSELGLELIKDGKAECLTSSDDILEFYGITRQTQDEKFDAEDLGLTDEETVIYNFLRVEDLHITELVECTKYDIKKLNILLTNMEISGIISKLAGGYYTLNT